MKLSIIIVNYNVKYYLEQCLSAVAKASCATRHEVEVFVVDNNSTDGSVEYIKKRFPETIIIANKENVGFAKANNQAIEQSKGEFIMLLNPDTIIGEESLNKCISFLDSHKDAGALGVKMLKSNGTFALESRRGIPTPFTSFCKMTGLCNLFPQSRIFGRYYMQYLNKEEANRIEIISGACMIIRRKAMEISGTLDETFFMYGEDIDMSYRLLKTGYNNYYVPVPILHYKGESTEKSSYRYVYVFYKAMLIFFRKHYGHYSILLSLPIKSAICFKAVCTYILEQMKKTKDISSGRETALKKSYLFIGTDKSLPIMEDIAKRNRLKFSSAKISEEMFKKGHSAITASNKYDYIVYDTDVFRYEDILSFFEKNEDHHAKMGTFTTKNNCIITDAVIIQ